MTERKNTYKVRKGYSFFIGEGRDSKVYGEGYSDGDIFEATDTEIKGQEYKIEPIESSQDETQELNNDKGFNKPPKDKMQKSAVKK